MTDEPDFASLAEGLRLAGRESFQEIVDSVRKVFPGKGPTRYDRFIKQLDTLPKTFHVHLPELTQIGRTSTITKWLDEARRGNVPPFRGLILQWLWTFDPILFSSIVDAALSKPSTSKLINKTDTLQDRRWAVTILFLDGEPTKIIEDAIQLMEKYGLAVRMEPIKRHWNGSLKTVVETVTRSSWLVVLYYSSVTLTDFQRHPLSEREYAAAFGSNWDKITLLRSFNLDVSNISQALSHLKTMEFVDCDMQPEKVSEDIARLVHKSRIGYDNLFAFKKELSLKNEGRLFIEQSLSLKMTLNGGEASLAIVDVDDMTKINKYHGEKIGDLILMHISEMLSSRFNRSEHMSGRCGDDTFYIVVFNKFDNSDAFKTILQDVANYEWQNEVENLHVTVSIGTAVRYEDEPGIDLAIRAALSMIEAKEAGGNCMKLSSRQLSGSKPRKLRNYFS